MKRYLLYPLRGGALVLLITFTLGWIIAFQARIMGILLAVLLTSWFFKYCFVLLDAVVAGAVEPPVLSVEMVNPVDEQRPVAQAMLIAGGGWLAVELGRLTAAPVGWVTGGAFLLLLPASVAVLGLSGNPLRAAWPPELLSVIRGIGRDYAVLLILIVAVAVLLYAIAGPARPGGC